MRALLHLGLFVLAFTVVGRASADHDDEDRRRERRTSIVIAPEIEYRSAPPVRARRGPMPRPVAVQPPRPHRGRGIAEARREVYEQQRDHDEIVRITHRWKRAAQERNPHAQRNAERRVQLWIDREIDESSRKPNHGRYVHRLHSLRRELRKPYGWHSYGRGRGRGLHRAHAHKVRVLDELVDLSAHQVRRAKAQARERLGLAFAYR
jgi:hypothetical protein